MTNKPTHEVRLGAVKGAIWRNKTETGDTRFNVKLSRIYKDGDDWKSVDSFGRDDLLVVGKVADMIHTWIHQQEQNDANAKRVPTKNLELPPGEFK